MKLGLFITKPLSNTFRFCSQVCIYIYLTIYFCLNRIYTQPFIVMFVTQDLEERMGYLVGDVLVASAFMSYTGPFLSNYRDELTQKVWLAEVSRLIFQ